MRRALQAASRPAEPPQEVMASVLKLLRRLWLGELTEFRIVSTRRGVDSFETKKTRL